MRKKPREAVWRKTRSLAEEGEMMKKWYSLIDKAYRMSNLREAYRQVRANRGAPGIDR
ncbi:MAG: hypothetical protein RJR35_12235 [Thermoanaerobacterales bacterium]|nr:hypothetical protein [Thermoanaerobacterales bacterium]